MRQLTAPLSTWVGDDPTLLPTVILAVPDDQDDGLDDDLGGDALPPPPAFASTPEDAVEGGSPPPSVDVVHLADGQRGVQEVQPDARWPARDELL